MSGRRALPALDGFRWFAALLVVAIHTSPLSGVNPEADFLLTRMLGRVAVLIRGRRAPVAGRVCMDQMLVDVTDVPGVAPGGVVTLIGCDGEAMIRCEEVAEWCGTISNEILSRLGPRLERIDVGRPV